LWLILLFDFVSRVILHGVLTSYSYLFWLILTPCQLFFSLRIHNINPANLMSSLWLIMISHKSDYHGWTSLGSILWCKSDRSGILLNMLHVHVHICALQLGTWRKLWMATWTMRYTNPHRELIRIPGEMIILKSENDDWQSIKSITPDDNEQVSAFSFNEKSWYKLTQVYTSKRSGKSRKWEQCVELYGGTAGRM